MIKQNAQITIARGVGGGLVERGGGGRGAHQSTMHSPWAPRTNALARAVFEEAAEYQTNWMLSF